MAQYSAPTPTAQACSSAFTLSYGQAIHNGVRTFPRDEGDYGGRVPRIEIVPVDHSVHDRLAAVVEDVIAGYQDVLAPEVYPFEVSAQIDPDGVAVHRGVYPLLDFEIVVWNADYPREKQLRKDKQNKKRKNHPLHLYSPIPISDGKSELPVF
jgi:hypothetical protein